MGYKTHNYVNMTKYVSASGKEEKDAKRGGKDRVERKKERTRQDEVVEEVK